LVVATVGLFGAAPASGGLPFGWQPFPFVTDAAFPLIEKAGLLIALVIAIAGLVYAFVLAKQVYAHDTGTTAMQAVAKAVRDGADAYLSRQFRVVFVLLVVLTALIIAAKWPWQLADSYATHDERIAVTLGRGVAFLMGAIFSASVGFIGMRLATAGNVRVAAAAKKGFGEAMRLAYKTGTVTGMFTCGLGLLGGTLNLLFFGELAYETLLGFGFGGSLLALFMRVGGGIYTKAADVGADLVGKIEKDMPEDDPRNAATIADNVGDNVGDCAGMAADVFESYAVTMVAAVMLGYAAFGVKGMVFPLVVLAVGVVCSMISTALVGRGMTTGTASGAMKRINRGFWRSAALSVAGFMALGALFLSFDALYVVEQAIDRGMFENKQFQSAIGFTVKPGAGGVQPSAEAVAADVRGIWDKFPRERQAEIAGSSLRGTTMAEVAARYVPLPIGIDMRAAFACLIGIILAVFLNRCTEYWTSTEYSPVKGVVKSSRTGHATNIISGLSLGYESAVWSVLIIGGAIIASVMVFSASGSPIFVAFGVAMCGIGMLTLTGDTISMDVFGPVADNASGIGEMGYNRAADGSALTAGQDGHLTQAEEHTARHILTDLDAVGNTTKAITKGIAIGSAVIAAVSLFATFVAVLVTGSEDKIATITAAKFVGEQGKLTVADPFLFVGMLIGAAVPFLFSAMTIRAVGRAAYLIVNECRRQFNLPGIREGKQSPDYGRVVDICTSTAQRELIGPGLLAIFTPLLVGFVLGQYALGGFLAGMIVSGQLLAVFMSNAGGAWDNAKKMVEDEEVSAMTGKRSPKHKASVTGDTVGDPLKDTAGPAINPLLKVMNMVGLLALPFVVTYNVRNEHGDLMTGFAIAAVAGTFVALAWWMSKQPSKAEREIDAQFDAEEREAIEVARRERGESKA